MATVAADRLFGKSIKRREDPRFITGQGQYVDDLKLPGMTYAAFVRSPHAHARIRKIDTAAALAAPGCHRRLHRQGHDRRQLAALRLGPPQGEEHPGRRPGSGDGAAHAAHVGCGQARGDPVAVVIADSQEAAVDAAEKVQVDWEPLPAVTATERAAQSGAPQLHADAPGNVAFKWEIGDRSDTDAAFKGAAVTVKKRIINQRLVANAMERARVRGPLRGRDRRPDPLGDVAESARAPAAHVRLRARHSRAQGAGDRARRRRRLRLQDLPLQRGGRLLLGVPPAQAAGALDRQPSRGVSDGRARP